LARTQNPVSLIQSLCCSLVTVAARFVYDLHIPSAEQNQLQPQPLDGEVESFAVNFLPIYKGILLNIGENKLLPLDEVVLRMRKGEFKPNCALGLWSCPLAQFDTDQLSSSH
jgi:hypothetical protein